ncbi:MAG: hypothetical protein K8R88_14475, partial [Armatimonadetes bacterium]|nr:hypothetical protein [Armatimonadota bacterium]
IQKEAELAFDRIGELKVFARWQEALNAMQSVDLMFVDLVATLEEPHKIAGYEKFANAKMIHDVAKYVKLVLIAAPQGYDLDFMVGYPDFLFAQLPRPVTHKMLLRMSTYV